MTETVNADIQKLEPGALVELYVLDATAIGGDMLYFHGDTKQGFINWQTQPYSPWPITAEGFARTSDQPPVPKLTVANLEGAISALCRDYDDLVGAKLTRIRTFGKYLDAVNFDGPELVTNPGFDNDGDSWTQSGTPTKFLNSQAVVSDVGGTDGYIAQQLTGVVTGKTYRISIHVVQNTTTAVNGMYLGVGPSAGFGFDTANVYQPSTGYIGVWEYEFMAARNDPWLTLKVATADTHVVIGSVSVKEKGVNPTADPTQEFPREIWYIERKTAETNLGIEFELVTAMDLNGVMLPRRQIIANHCMFVAIGGYRGPYCGYTGPPVAKADDTPTTDMAEDKCGGKLKSCKLRQWPNNVLNFGGYPAAGLMRS